MQSMKRNKLRNAISVALVLGATGFTGAAFAQDSAEAKEIDTITVTGTRIKSQTVTASSPVSEIGKEEFKVAGATRVDDLVNQYPQMSPYFDSFANNGALGYPSADLRGLGTNRTLTLINGRRIQPGSGIAPDLSIIPAALIQRVDLLTGGASAVYGADAVAGVVNFVLDSEFEGISLNAGYSAYQHNNDNEYLQGKMDARGFDYPTGSSGLDGQSQNIDMVFGSQFADGNGHATAWLTWRKNDALYWGQRDYSSCALNGKGTGCGGSGTAPNPNFIFLAFDENGDLVGDESIVGAPFARLNSDNEWVKDSANVYNYAPINFYQRPETKINFGATVKYEINEHARPYVELMYSNRDSEIQVAESGTFFGQTLNLNCDSPLLGTACSDLGIDANRDLIVYVGKRNVEGGPRNFSFNDSSYRVVTGVEGAINDNWSYDISMLYGKNNTSEVGVGDFLSSRITDALLNCADEDLVGTSACYNVWQYGGVTADAANALAGTRMQATETSITSVNGYVSGDTGFGFVEGSNIGLVAGFEWRKEKYSSMFDSFSQAGDFAGAGGPSLPLSGQTEVKEMFVEAGVPVFKGDGFVKSFNLDLGYRYSDYELSGAENTWKVGFTSDIASLRFRGGFNKAIRAPNISELFSQSQIALWSGSDPCAGVLDSDPETTSPSLSFEQCENTGVDADQWGNIPESPAGQYNQFIGGNSNLSPEQAETWTFGFAFTPVENLDIAIDYYDIKIEDTISTVGADVIIDACAKTNDTTLCSFIKRNPATGDLWIGEAGYVINPTRNFGETMVRGVDINASYRWDMWGGRMSASFVGTRNLEYTVAPLAGLNDDITYDCAGLFNSSCQLPEWRHIASLRYGNELFSLNLRWRHFGSMDYINTDGTPGVDDALILANDGKIDSYDYFDLSGSINLSDSVDLTIGVNNVADKEPPMVGGNSAPQNGNAIGGYDQAGRYIFANLGVKF